LIDRYGSHGDQIARIENLLRAKALWAFRRLRCMFFWRFGFTARHAA
jgi:hypothetical protein